MGTVKRIGVVLLIGAAACGGLKHELGDTPQQHNAKLQAQLDSCNAENQRLKGGAAAPAPSTQPAATADIREQLADTPQKQTEELNAKISACEAENQSLRAQASPAK